MSKTIYDMTDSGPNQEYRLDTSVGPYLPRVDVFPDAGCC